MNVTILHCVIAPVIVPVVRLKALVRLTRDLLARPRCVQLVPGLVGQIRHAVRAFGVVQKVPRHSGRVGVAVRFGQIHDVGAVVGDLVGSSVHVVDAVARVQATDGATYTTPTGVSLRSLGYMISNSSVLVWPKNWLVIVFLKRLIIR